MVKKGKKMCRSTNGRKIYVQKVQKIKMSKKFQNFKIKFSQKYKDEVFFNNLKMTKGAKQPAKNLDGKKVQNMLKKK